MSKKPYQLVGHALRMANVPAAEEIAWMLRKKPLLFGWVYGDMVFSRVKWDEETYPYALMYDSGSTLTCYVSASPFRFETVSTYSKYTYIDAPYMKATYTGGEGWSEFTETLEGDAQSIYGTTAIFWTNTDIVDADGSVVFFGQRVYPLYYGDNRPTAFLYSTGAINFKSRVEPDANKTVIGAYVGWENKKCTSTAMVPWLRIDQSTLVSATIDADAIPSYTDYWFYGCKNFKTFTPPEGLTRIGDYTFYGSDLYAFKFPSTLIEIGNRAYSNLVYNSSEALNLSRQKIVIPDTVEKIGDYAFYNIELVGQGYVSGSLTINDAPVEIGKYAFGYCERLKSAKIGKNVKRIHPYAFRQCGIMRSGGGSIYTNTYGSITFEATDGWWISQDADATSGTAIDVTSSGQNALNLAGAHKWNGSYISSSFTIVNGVYDTYYWNHCVDHIANEPVVENLVEATTETDGSYDSVVYCARCGTELSRETIIVPALAAEDVEETEEE